MDSSSDDERDDTNSVISMINAIINQTDICIDADSILQYIFKTNNITHDDIYNIIIHLDPREKKCEECDSYSITWHNGKYVLRCQDCRHINKCHGCYQKVIYNKRLDHHGRTLDIWKKCPVCSTRLLLECCAHCKNPSCTCGCPHGCKC